MVDDAQDRTDGDRRRMSSCGRGLTVDRDTIEVYDRSAADYAEKFDTAAPDRHLRRFMSLVAEGARVLDIGCGTGNACVHLSATGFRAEGIDASKEMVAAACAKGVNARQANFESVDGNGVFGGVWANFSLLHAPREDMPGLLARIARSLTSGGILHIGLKTGTGESRDHLGRLYTYYEEDELAGLLADAGFTETGEDRGLAGTSDQWIIIVAHV